MFGRHISNLKLTGRAGMIYSDAGRVMKIDLRFSPAKNTTWLSTSEACRNGNHLMRMSQLMSKFGRK